MRVLEVVINEMPYVIYDDSDDGHIDIYIPGLFKMVQVDYRTTDDDFLVDIVKDIRESRIKVYEYALGWIKITDFQVEAGEWSDYPRPNSLGRALLKYSGKQKLIGVLRLR